MRSLHTIYLVLLFTAGLSGCADERADNPMIPRHEAMLTEQAGNVEAAIEIRKEILESYPGYPFMWEVQYEQGLSYMDIDDVEAALECFNKSIEDNPDYNFAYIRRAECYELLQESEASIDDSNRAFELSEISPEFATLFSTRGNAYELQGEFAQAAQNWELALIIDPYVPSALYKLSGYLLRTEQPEQALSYLDRFVEIEEDDAEINLMRGIALAKLDRIEEAEQALQRAREMNEANPEQQIEIPHSTEELLLNLSGPPTPRARFPEASPLPVVAVNPLQQRAYEISRQFLENEGFQCEPSSNDHFLYVDCQLENKQYSIRVKYVLEENPETFGLTEAELEQMMQHSPPAGLIVITGLKPGSTTKTPTERVAAFTRSWRPDPSMLSPIAYQYPLPKP